jgi:hypothetical protein
MPLLEKWFPEVSDCHKVEKRGYVRSTFGQYNSKDPKEIYQQQKTILENQTKKQMELKKL